MAADIQGVVSPRHVDVKYCERKSSGGGVAGEVRHSKRCGASNNESHFPNARGAGTLCRVWCGMRGEWLRVMHVHEDSACERQDFASKRHELKHVMVP